MGDEVPRKLHILVEDTEIDPEESDSDKQSGEQSDRTMLLTIHPNVDMDMLDNEYDGQSGKQRKKKGSERSSLQKLDVIVSEEDDEVVKH